MRFNYIILLYIILSISIPINEIPLSPASNLIDSEVNLSNNNLSNNNSRYNISFNSIRNIPISSSVIQLSDQSKYSMNVIINNNTFFDGYNVFMLEQQDTSDYTKDIGTYMIVDMYGNIINEINVSSGIYSDVKLINSTTMLLQNSYAGVYLWNFYTNEKTFLFAHGIHHDISYNPYTQTFIGIKHISHSFYGIEYMYQELIEVALNGSIIWSLDLSSIISPLLWNGMEYSGGKRDVTHANTVFWDVEEDILYVNLRNLNTFYKIEHKTKQVIWGLGEYGNFTLFDIYGTKRTNLFYHAHSIEKLNNNTFILFDNDYYNQTSGPKRSKMIEITINETKMTANISWSWSGPYDYFSAGWSDADRLPNGNRFGTFGYSTHPSTSIGARLVEVNNEGKLLWEMNFQNNQYYRYGIYRADRFRKSPIIDSPVDIIADYSHLGEIRANWTVWYNFRANYNTYGNFTLYLNNEPIQNGLITFKKFWQPLNLSFLINNLPIGVHNITLEVADEAGHSILNNITIYNNDYYLSRKGPIIIEQGQNNSKIIWSGGTTKMYRLNISANNNLVNTFEWNGEEIIFDLNILNPGKYNISLILINQTNNVIYEDRFEIQIFQLSNPFIDSFPNDLTLIWNNYNQILNWEIFDISPYKWDLFMNGDLFYTGNWITSNYTITWLIPVLPEGIFNVTILVEDLMGLKSSTTTLITVKPPLIPSLKPLFNQTEYKWGENNITLTWETHGGYRWEIFRNSTLFGNGFVKNNLITLQISSFNLPNWLPGLYNITMQVFNENNTSTIINHWIFIFLGNPYANSYVSEFSTLGTNYMNALGIPDGIFAQIYFDYFNGYITLDMGAGEEIIDNSGYDFKVIANGGFYRVLAANSLDEPFIDLGIHQGVVDIDLLNGNLTQARYVQLMYNSGGLVNIDSIVAYHYHKIDDRPPEIILKPDNINVLSNQSQINLVWNVFDSNPRNYSIQINNTLFIQKIWDSMKIQVIIPITAIGTLEIAIYLEDIFGHRTEDIVIITILAIEKQRPSTITSITSPTLTSITSSATTSIKSKTKKSSFYIGSLILFFVVSLIILKKRKNLHFCYA